MDRLEFLFLLADEQTRAKAREIIGSEQHAILLAQAVLNDGERLNVEAVEKVFKIGKRAAQKRVKKTGRKTCQ